MPNELAQVETKTKRHAVATPTSRKSDYWVPMVANAFKILEAFTSGDTGLRQHEISKLTTVNGTSTFRILFTLGRLGYVWRDPATQKYQLGNKIAEAAQRATSQGALVQLARAHLERLRDRFDETVNLATLQNNQVFYQEVLESTNPFRLTLPAGSLAPVHSTALGKAIAAFLPEERLRALLSGYKFVRLTPRTLRTRKALMRNLASVRRKGYSLDREESVVGVSCVATPILDASGHSLAAISLAAPSQRMRRKEREVTGALKQASAAISRLSHGEAGRAFGM